MNEYMINAIPVTPSQRVKFKCIGCGNCCKHVPQSVPLETLDVFRIAKYLNGHGSSIKSMDDFLAQSAEPVLLDECGFFVFMLKTYGDDNACVLLKDNRCTIHAAKPRTCRMYPFVAGPSKSGRFEYLLSREQPHHFKGPTIEVKRWMNQYFYPEEKETLYMDYNAVPKIAALLRKIPDQNRARAEALFLYYRYSNYDLNGSFLEQFSRNLENLQFELMALISPQQ